MSSVIPLKAERAKAIALEIYRHVSNAYANEDNDVVVAALLLAAQKVVHMVGSIDPNRGYVLQDQALKIVREASRP